MRLMVASRNRTGIICLKNSSYWALAIVVFAVTIHAQSLPKGSPTGEPQLQPGEQPNRNTEEFPTLEPPEPLNKPAMVEDEACLPWNLPDMRGPTVSAMRLGVPPKARGKYQKACESFKKKKLTDAEQHARGAIQDYAKYLAAWVMLGEVLQGQQKINEARDACSQAMTLDPTYLPPYLCLAGLLQRENAWTDLVDLSGRFLGMSAVGDMYAYYYRSLAEFTLHNLPEAQKNISQAIAIASDTGHNQPNFYFLLAEICGENGDLANATLAINRFLKVSTDREQRDTAKLYLEKLQSQENTK
jgi:tetratricopeptide (TPR) repeat protein